MRFLLFFMVLILVGLGYRAASAHEMVPAYFNLKESPVENVYEATFKLFNRRDDVDYYQVLVYDKDWNNLPFASFDRVFKLEYLKRKEIKVYIQEKHIFDVTYVCTQSKLYKGEGAYVASRICSKIDK